MEKTDVFWAEVEVGLLLFMSYTWLVPLLILFIPWRLANRIAWCVYFSIFALLIPCPAV